MALRKTAFTHTVGTDLSRNKVQIVTLAGVSGGDSFKLSYNGSATAAFVAGVNMTQAAIQAALRTLTGDAALTATGTTDVGPFTVTFTATPVDILTVTNVSGMTGVVTVNVSDLTLTLKNIGPYRLFRVVSSGTLAGSPTYELTEVSPGTTEWADESPADVTINSGAGVLLDSVKTSGLGFTDGDIVTFTLWYETQGDRRF